MRVCASGIVGAVFGVLLLAFSNGIYAQSLDSNGSGGVLLNGLSPFHKTLSDLFVGITECQTEAQASHLSQGP